MLKKNHRSKGQNESALTAFEPLELRQLFSAPAFDTYLIGPNENLTPIASTADSQGNVLILGSFTGSVDFNPKRSRSFVLDGGSDDNQPGYFVAKYTASGKLYWVLPFIADSSLGTTTPDLAGIALDSSDNIFLTGTIDGTIDADPGRKAKLRSPTGGFDAILMKFKSDRTFLGATTTTIGGNDADTVDQIKIDKAGNAYIGGLYVTNDTGDLAGFVAKFNAHALTFAWWNNVADNVGVTLGLDRSQMPVLVAESGSAAEMVINRFSATGRFVSRQSLTSSASTAGEITPVSVDFDSKNNPLIAGNLIGFADFDPAQSDFVLGPKLATDATSNVFLAKYSPKGKLIFGKAIGSTGNDETGGAIIDRPTGNIYLSGSFDGAVDFDPGKSGVFLMDTGDHSDTPDALSDLFVVKLTDSGSFINATQLGAPATRDTVTSMALGPSGRVYVVGTSIFDAGDAIALLDTIR
jgi:hypothetical protein